MRPYARRSFAPHADRGTNRGAAASARELVLNFRRSDSISSGPFFAPTISQSGRTIDEGQMPSVFASGVVAQGQRGLAIGDAAMRRVADAEIVEWHDVAPLLHQFSISFADRTNLAVKIVQAAWIHVAIVFAQRGFPVHLVGQS